MFCSSCRPERNPVGLVVERRGDLDAGDRVVGERHANRARHLSAWRRWWRRSRARYGPRRSRRCRSRRRGRWRQPREAGEPARGVDRVARRRDVRVDIGDADRHADQRDAVGHVQRVGPGAGDRRRAGDRADRNVMPRRIANPPQLIVPHSRFRHRDFISSEPANSDD